MHEVHSWGGAAEVAEAMHAEDLLREVGSLIDAVQHAHEEHLGFGGHQWPIQRHHSHSALQHDAKHAHLHNATMSGVLPACMPQLP